MSEQVKLGKVAMTLGGDYSSSQVYDKLTCVQYDGCSWVSKKQVPEGVAPTPANSAYWQKISDRGVQGPQGQSYVDKELVPIVNDLTTGGSANVLSAEQGKILKTELTELSETFGVFLVLEKGGMSGGKPADVNLDTRCRTQLMNIGGDVSVTLNEGYALYYYIYKLDGSAVLFNEDVNTGLELKGYQGHLIRFVFRKVDNSPISVSDNIVKSLMGVYDLEHTRLDEVEQSVETLEQSVDELAEKTECIDSAGIADLDDEIIIEDNNGEQVCHMGAMTEETYASEQRWESNDGSELYAKIDENGIEGKVSRISPAISIPAVVEPSDDIVDEGYSSPIGRNNVKRADWAAENKYTYYDFLAHYYDGYLGETDGYSVTKKSLGSDASNSGYELFEYDFCPLNYKKVVMISAGMNTCETGALWGLVTFIKAMMTSNEEGFKFLRENVRFKVLPMICPSSFDKDTLAYPNANGVRINKNFDYCRNWYDVPETNKGEYPDSEVESRILKAWLNENAWKADLYIDCHQDPDKNVNQINDLTIVICSDSVTNNKLKECFPSLVQFYRDKGYIPSGVTPNTSSWVEGGRTYPKTKYAKKICGIPAIMIEQYCSSTMYGSDGNTINDAAGIKNYATMLRLYTFAILQGEQSANSCWLSSLIH